MARPDPLSDPRLTALFRTNPKLEQFMAMLFALDPDNVVPAWCRLLKDGCDPQMLALGLHTYSLCRKVRKGSMLPGAARKARLAAKTLSNLVQLGLERGPLRRTPKPMPFFSLDPLVVALTNIKASAIRISAGSQAMQAWWLVEGVKKRTGSEHHVEVATLLGATIPGGPAGARRAKGLCDPDGLKMAVNRLRRESSRR